MVKKIGRFDVLEIFWGQRVWLVGIGLSIFILSWLFSFYRSQQFFEQVVVLPFLFFCIKDGINAVRQNWVLQVVLVFLMYMFCTIFFHGVLSFDLVSYWARLTGWVFLFVMSGCLVSEKLRRDYLGWVFSFGGFVASVASITNYFQHYTEPGGAFRLYSVFSHGNAVTSGFMFLQGAVWALVLSLHAKQKVWVFLSALAYASSIIAVACTFSRGVLLALFSTWLVLLIVGRTRKSILLFVLGVLVLGATYLTTSVMDHRLMNEKIGSHGPGLGRIVGGETRDRTEIYSDLFEKSKRHFVFGTGLQSENTQFETSWGLFHPHSIPLWVLYHGGVIGLLMWAGMLGTAFWFGFKGAWVRRRYTVLLLVSGVSVLIFDGAYLIHSADAREWLLYWLPIALLAAEVSGSDHEKCKKGMR